MCLLASLGLDGPTSSHEDFRQEHEPVTSAMATLSPTPEKKARHTMLWEITFEIYAAATKLVPFMMRSAPTLYSPGAVIRQLFSVSLARRPWVLGRAPVGSVREVGWILIAEDATGATALRLERKSDGQENANCGFCPEPLARCVGTYVGSFAGRPGTYRASSLEDWLRWLRRSLPIWRAGFPHLSRICPTCVPT